MLKNSIPLAVEQFALRSAFPRGECKIQKNKLLWKCKVRPTPISNEYTLELAYTLNLLPEVFIPREELEKLDDPNFPHHYDIDENGKVKICLYLPCEFKNNKNLCLAKTVVPWAIEWLYFYEIWLITGEWKGGGLHCNE